jgi:hypothetical protein
MFSTARRLSAAPPSSSVISGAHFLNLLSTRLLRTPGDRSPGSSSTSCRFTLPMSTDDQKELHCTMRESWLSSYSKASHTVLQHWLGGSSRNRQNPSHPSTKCLRKSRSTRLTAVLLRGRKFSLCTSSPGHPSRTSSSLVASRRVSVSRMTQWLLLLTTSPLSTPLSLNSATCSP